MVKYNFSSIINRENTSCVKYDLRKVIFNNDKVIPMWVADMDIATPDFILTTIKERCEHPILGYSIRDKLYHDSIVAWIKKRHAWEIRPEWINYCPGVVAGLNQIIMAFTSPGDRIMIQPPVYHPFFHTVQNNSRELVLNTLQNTNGNYTMNFDDLEEKFKTNIKMFILSNPHNPVGRVWKKDELEQLASLCLKYNVLLISDEIHSDLVFAPNKHIPIASLNNEILMNTITLSSPSKTFNTAGLASGYVIIPNKEHFDKYQKSLDMTGAGLGNIFGFEALKSSYTDEGENWLTQLLFYLKGNVELVSQYISEKTPLLKVTPIEGTYLMWIDFRAIKLSDNELNNKLINEAGLGLNRGSIFGDEGVGFQRMNIACSRILLQEALDRLGKSFG